MASQRFRVTVADGGRGRILVPVPFDADAMWGTKGRHHVRGTVNGLPVRGTVEAQDEGYGFLLGPAWLRGGHLDAGGDADVLIEPEGPQRADLAEDVAEARDANPKAGGFFDSLAQFYRRGYLRWVDATTREPELRAERIATMVRLLEAGAKDYHDA